jgi:hypothetical protein
VSNFQSTFFYSLFDLSPWKKEVDMPELPQPNAQSLANLDKIEAKIGKQQAADAAQASSPAFFPDSGAGFGIKSCYNRA